MRSDGVCLTAALDVLILYQVVVYHVIMLSWFDLPPLLCASHTPTPWLLARKSMRVDEGRKG